MLSGVDALAVCSIPTVDAQVPPSSSDSCGSLSLPADDRIGIFAPSRQCPYASRGSDRCDKSACRAGRTNVKRMRTNDSYETSGSVSIFLPKDGGSALSMAVRARESRRRARSDFNWKVNPAEFEPMKCSRRSQKSTTMIIDSSNGYNCLGCTGSFSS